MDSKTPQKRFRIGSSERGLILLLGDILMAGAALFMALYFWAAGDAWMEFSLEFIVQRPPFWFFMLPVIWVILLVSDLFHLHT